MDTLSTVLVIFLGVLGGAFAASVAWALWHRTRHTKPDADVDELALEVARLAKIVRRDRMANVRSAREPQPEAAADAPPELRQHRPLPQSRSKAELRLLAARRNRLAQQAHLGGETAVEAAHRMARSYENQLKLAEAHAKRLSADKETTQ